MEDNLGTTLIRVHRYTGSELVFLRIAESTTPAAIRYLGGGSHSLCLISKSGVWGFEEVTSIRVLPDEISAVPWCSLLYYRGDEAKRQKAERQDQTV